MKRVSLARVDNRDRRRNIEMARSRIYKDKYRVNCKDVEDILKGESLVPTSVRHLYMHIT